MNWVWICAMLRISSWCLWRLPDLCFNRLCRGCAWLCEQMFAGQVLQCLYGGSPNVSFFKGDGEPQLGSILDMPDNSSSGAVRTDACPHTVRDTQGQEPQRKE
jgi:hypothetical protein